jgi:hypothetical protein
VESSTHRARRIEETSKSTMKKQRTPIAKRK